MTARRAIALLLALTAVAAAAVALRAAFRARGPATPAESVTLGLALQPPSALAMIAERQGYFAAEGLDVTVQPFPSGKRALEALLAGQVEAATTAETPVVFASFERRDFRIAASIAVSHGILKVVARRDRGIAAPGDLRGKRVATQEASAAHFFLHLFLLKHGLSAGDVALSYRNVEDLPAALAKGDIDAFCMREPMVSRGKALLGDRAVVFAEPSLYLWTEQLVAAAVLVDRRPEALRRMLRGLIRAEDWASGHRDGAIRIVAARLGADESEIASLWNELELKVALRQPLLLGLEEEARWAVAGGWISRTPKPNFLDFVYPDALAAVKPGAVTLIR